MRRTQAGSPKGWRRFLKIIGPGFITGASDDDPSGILTYSQTGATFGYRHLWLAVLTLPFMVVVQEMCGRIGMVAGKGLAAVLRQHYPRPVLFGAVSLLFLANAVNIGADLGAMASAAQMLFGLPFVAWLAGITVTILLLEILIRYRAYSRILKYFTLSLFAYVVTMFLVEQEWGELFASTVVPRLTIDRESVMNIVAIFGTTISPYLFFWQADEEVEEEVANHKLAEAGIGKPHIKRRDVREMRWDTVIGMVFCNFIAYCIIVTAASTLHETGVTDIATAADAARALEPIAGEFASILFALGVIGTGLLAVPVLAGSASYAVAETAGWKASLDAQFTRAPGFYIVMMIAVLVGVAVNLAGIPPFRMLYYTAILNGICAPPLLFLILLMANDRRVVGRYRNGWTSNVLGGAIALFMGGAAILFLVL